MSRYIDADAYAAELWKLRQNYQMLDDTQTADKIMHGIFRAEQVLKEQPTVDAVPVVRCAKCKWWWKANGLCTHPKHCHDNVCVHECGKDYYCADGEREKQ